MKPTPVKFPAGVSFCRRLNQKPANACRIGPNPFTPRNIFQKRTIIRRSVIFPKKAACLFGQAVVSLSCGTSL